MHFRLQRGAWRTLQGLTEESPSPYFRTGYRAGFVIRPVVFAVVFGGAALLDCRANRANQAHTEGLGCAVTVQTADSALGVTAAPEGARLNCRYQKLVGRATSEGLWVESTEAGSGGSLRIVASAVGRVDPGAGNGGQGPRVFGENFWASDLSELLRPGGKALTGTGTLCIESNLVRFSRPSAVEEYSVDLNGIRQDFLIREAPSGPGELWLELAVAGAEPQKVSGGLKLVLRESGRALAYSTLRVTDATGRELAADFERMEEGEFGVRVCDAEAVYPVRIDPIFSDADWVSLGTGTIPEVDVMAGDEAGNLYVGGSFNMIGETFANGIAKWDGTSWSPLGLGISASPSSGQSWGVKAIAVAGEVVYVGGIFTSAGGGTANNIAKWDGTSWTALGDGTDGEVRALLVNGSQVYAGGNFTHAGGLSVSNIARWDGAAWSPLRSGVNGAVYALAAIGTSIYAGGFFSTAGGVTAVSIARWNGDEWSAVGTGSANGAVVALAASGTSLYASGGFYRIGELQVNHIAKWDGQSWSALGSGLDGAALSMAIMGTDLYAGGDIRIAGGRDVKGLARWNGNEWSSLEPAVNAPGARWFVWAMAARGAELCFSGAFIRPEGPIEHYLGKLTGSTWFWLDPGLNGRVLAVAAGGDELYIGGEFTTVGHVEVNGIAKWNGSRWSALGTGVYGPVRPGGERPCVQALAVSGSNVYAAGMFTSAGGVVAGCIARWDGQQWWALPGLTAPYPTLVQGVNKLAAIGGELYAAGMFTTEGPAPATNVAKWNGSAWLPVRAPWSSIDAFAVGDDGLYAAGSGASSSGVAKWDGKTWSILGTGINGSITSLAVVGSNVYAGGSFTAGGSACNVAKWDGAADWLPVGGGTVSGYGGWPNVYALAAVGAELYAGGSFTNVGGVAAANIARWDGTHWSALGSGVNNKVSALVNDGAGHLFVGGEFFVAGTNVSRGVALANVGGTPPGGVVQGIQAEPGLVRLHFLGVPGCAYHVERATDVRFMKNLSILLRTNCPAAGGCFCYVDSNPPGECAFYRLHRQ